jgi:hypothetical protein
MNRITPRAVHFRTRPETEKPKYERSVAGQVAAVAGGAAALGLAGKVWHGQYAKTRTANEHAANMRTNPQYVDDWNMKEARRRAEIKARKNADRQVRQAYDKKLAKPTPPPAAAPTPAAAPKPKPKAPAPVKVSVAKAPAKTIAQRVAEHAPKPGATTVKKVLAPRIHVRRMGSIVPRAVHFAGLLPDGKFKTTTGKFQVPANARVSELPEGLLATYTHPASFKKQGVSTSDIEPHYGTQIARKAIHGGGAVARPYSSPLLRTAYGDARNVERLALRHELVHALRQQRRGGPPKGILPLVREEVAAYAASPKKLRGMPMDKAGFQARATHAISGVVQSVKHGRKSLGIPAWKLFRSIVPRAVHFSQTRHGDGTFEIGTSPLSAYRKASRVVPWVRRASEAAGDLGDIAVGRKPKDPFYKKSWFKRAAQTAAIAAPVAAYALTLKGRGRAARGEPGLEGMGGKIAARGDKILRKFNMSAITPRAVHFARGDHALAAWHKSGPIPFLGKGGNRAALKLAEAVARKDAAGFTKASKVAARMTGRPPPPELASLAAARSDAAKSFWSDRKNFRAITPRTVHFSIDPRDKGWDLRDARGKSARVYAPGSRRRERREKEWGEKTDNIRLVRNAAIVTSAGLGGLALYQRNKIRKLTPRKHSVVGKAKPVPLNVVPFPRQG